MNKKIIASIVVIAVASMLLGAGTYSYFSDTETSTGNTFTAGTLDLTVDAKTTGHIELDNIKPGQKQWFWWLLTNIGTITGQPYVTFSAIANKENDVTEPERELGDSGPDGELGAYLKVKMGQQDPKYYDWGPDREYNYRGKGVLNDLDPSVCYGKPPEEGRDVDSKARIGDLSRFGGYYFQELGSGESVVFMMQIYLPEEVGNIVQSDSVSFDIIFHLDQAP